MRTFEEIQEALKINKTVIMQRSMKKLQEGGLDAMNEMVEKGIVQDCQSYIDNIEEVTTINIGANTNSLIHAIQRAYQQHLTDYWQNFERFVDEYVTGLTPDGKPKDGNYFGQSQSYMLGVGVNELLCFKGRNPMNDDVCNLFRQTINANYGTNIPMAGVEQQALQNFEAVAFSDDTVARDKAFMHLKEVQRDSGALINGGKYYLLATNQLYQQAKARCSGRSL